MKVRRVRIHCAPSPPAALETMEGKFPPTPRNMVRNECTPYDAGRPEHRHRGGSGAGKGREGARGVVSGAGGVAGVPGGDEEAVVAGGGSGWCVKSLT